MTEARDDLVKDQRHPSFPGHLPELLQERPIGRNGPRGSPRRLEDHPPDLVIQKLLEGTNVIGRAEEDLPRGLYRNPPRHESLVRRPDPDRGIVVPAMEVAFEF